VAWTTRRGDASGEGTRGFGFDRRFFNDEFEFDEENGRADVSRCDFAIARVLELAWMRHRVAA
jgi:hypothetical protein